MAKSIEAKMKRRSNEEEMNEKWHGEEINQNGSNRNGVCEIRKCNMKAESKQFYENEISKKMKSVMKAESWKKVCRKCENHAESAGAM